MIGKDWLKIEILKSIEYRIRKVNTFKILDEEYRPMHIPIHRKSTIIDLT